ncbi:TBC1 domain family member 2A [Mus musculus] [Rhizoctonia solani]|uniref:TBC1 domain family member 2A [Mus musculus] n=1 Tax=Rhizoctonia solani TaxID=456999 RepID=A0A0K6FUJ9_9AGAM|nr:TBC1 domain family member 2A [Mus musculus] [Rhizoctonia solani]
MSTEPDLRLTTAAGLETYLASTRYASTSIETVSGGHTGFLYRVVLKEPLETGEKTVIVKHTLEYAAQSIIDIANGGTPGPGRITLNVERMDFEHEALELVNSNPELSTIVRVPRVHTYDPHTHTLIMSDVAPCRLLSSVLQEADDELVSRIGRALGEFMGKFHKWTSLPEQAAARKRFLENTTSREDVLRIRWQLALAAAKKYHVERAWMEDMYLAGMQDGQSGTVICMADFWFDNILVSTQHDLAIWIVDWETTRSARPELDVAHFATAAYSLVHVHRPIPLMREFTKAYKAHMDLDETSLGTHAGRDMLSFGVVMPWIRHRDESIKQPIAQLGVELLEAAHTGDEQALRKNPVLADIQQMSLLRQALRTRASRSNIRPEESPPPKKSYAKSIKSVASVKTLAASLASFYTSKVPGSVGTSSPKRRRSPRSELGKPPFASKNPELKWVDGVEACDGPMVSGVSTVRTLDERVSLVVHHFGEPGERGVVFYGATSVSGQVRLVASKPDPIESIEVWVTLKSSCTFSSSEPNALELRATLYRNSGPLEPGTYVFPFIFDPFPESVVVRQEEKKNVTGRPLARVLLPRRVGFIRVLSLWF